MGASNSGFTHRKTTKTEKALFVLAFTSYALAIIGATYYFWKNIKELF